MTIATVIGNMLFMISFLIIGLFGYLIAGSFNRRPRTIIANMPPNSQIFMTHILEIFFFFMCFVNFPSSYFDAKTTLKHVYNLVQKSKNLKGKDMRDV